MTAVTYHGEYPEGQVDGEGEAYIEQHGYTFTRGESVNVKEEELVKKFAQNRFFKVAGKSEKEAVEQGQDEAEKAETEALRVWLTDHQVPFHHKAGLDKLRKARADYEAAQEKAQEA